VKAFKKQALSLDKVKLTVFDEADAVLGDEHSDHCLKLVDMMKEKNSQFVAFSATVTENLLQFFDSNFTNN
jgi:superfamily II DNA/RNA helicase